MIDWIKIYETVDIPAIFMGIGNIAFVLVMVRWHVENGPFDFRRSLLDSTGTFVSFSRLGQLVCLVASTEVLFYLATKDKLSEGYIGLYMGAWAGTAIYGKWQESKNAKEGVVVTKPDTPKEGGA